MINKSWMQLIMFRIRDWSYRQIRIIIFSMHFQVLLFFVLFTDFVDVTNEDIRQFETFKQIVARAESIVSSLVHITSVFMKLGSLAGRWSEYAKDSGKFNTGTFAWVRQSLRRTACVWQRSYAGQVKVLSKLVIQIRYRYISRVCLSFVCQRDRLSADVLDVDRIISQTISTYL